jgi:UDP-sugar transporter A1/2/3
MATRHEVDSDIVTSNRQKPAVSTAIRFLILISLTVQTSAFVLVRRLTAKKHTKFDKSSVLLVSEVLKMVVSIIAIQFGVGKANTDSEMKGLTQIEDSSMDTSEPTNQVSRLWLLFVTSGPMAIQAVIYLIQNILAYVALECLDAGTYSLLMQGKIFATAFFAMVIMRIIISPRQWRALLMLVLAVIQITHETKPHNSQSELSRLYFKGLVLTFVNVMLSGFSTVFMETIFKDQEKNMTIWERNFQLSVCSIVVYAGIVFCNNGMNFFEGWDIYAFYVAVLGSLGGILVAFSLKYTDSILKSMASTFSIFLTTVLEWWFMDGPMNVLIAVGGAFVLLSVYSYNDK